LILRLLAVSLLLATATSVAMPASARDQHATRATILVAMSAAQAAATAQPKPLHGVPLRGSTGLRLLVADDPPFLLDVDSGRITKVGGLDVRGNPVLSVLAVGKDAVVWLDRRTPASKVPRAEIYVLHHGTTVATRLATAWDVAPSADGKAVWLKSFQDAQRCSLRELGLDGRQRRGPRPLSCSSRLVDAGNRAVLIEGSSAVDPSNGRTLLRAGGVLAIAGHYAIGSAGPSAPLTLTDIRNGARRRLPWPSPIGQTDQAVVQASGRLVALGFADPAFQGSGTQVTDVWLLNPATRRFRHLPDMPADVALKFTSMSWTSDGRLIWLAETGGEDVVAVWRPGQSRIAVRRVRIPVRNSASDTFVVWPMARSR
jgi:hypothetical protein